MNLIRLVFIVVSPVIAGASVMFCLRAFRVRTRWGFLSLAILAVAICIVDLIYYWNFDDSSLISKVLGESRDGPPPPGLGLILLFSCWLLFRDEKEANHSLQTTTMAVTDAAAQPSRQP